MIERRVRKRGATSGQDWRRGVAGCLAVWAGLLGGPRPGQAAGADPFAEMVRTTPWLSPADALRSFVVPEGFAIQLVASEPEIGKPISMSFDVLGRLWIAETRIYPGVPASRRAGVEAGAAGNAAVNDGDGRGDVIRILSDFGADGRARRNVVYADGLNTPDAVAPVAGGAVIFTIPDVVRLRDTDGDGRADRREVLYGPFGVRDTHNLANNFRRGFDGWFYGAQGVGNQTTVRGTDGVAASFRGSTFRFRGDGRRIEVVGDGQANVFGICFDEWGHLFTSDCHSMPIYQVIHGGFYPVFGKPHDGLGYAPTMLAHDHGSTAISGLIQCREPLWPAEYQGNFFLGNVVTSRVNRDRLERRGSTQIAHEMPDLVRSRDPWFRPVDVQFGPDGALYIADFYNRIIAHVEVPLDHPGRDRRSGRIWRVVRLGADGLPVLRARPDYAALSERERAGLLEDGSLSFRLAVLNDLADRGGPEVIEAVRGRWSAPGAKAAGRVAALWILERLGALRAEDLAAAFGAEEPEVRTHACRILAERPRLDDAGRGLLRSRLADADPFVVRAAADAMSRHPDPAQLGPLLELRRRVPAEDTHLLYQVRKALRDHLRAPGGWERLGELSLTKPDRAHVADVAVAVASPGAAGFLAGRLEERAAGEPLVMEWVRHVVRHGGAADRGRVTTVLRRDGGLDLETRAAVYAAILQGTDQRGGEAGEELKSWGAELAAELLRATGPTAAARRRQGAELAERFRVASLEEPLARMATGRDDEPAGRDGDVRTAAWRALLAIRGGAYLAGAASFLWDAAVSTDRRADVAQAMARVNTVEARSMLVTVLREAPSRLGLRIAGSLAATAEGGAALLEAIEAGQASASLLGDRGLRERLLTVRPGETNRVARWLAGVPGDDARLQELAAARRAAFLKAPGDATAGAGVFQVQCAPCHSVGGQGGNIGPQLDGIGHRGVERLCEDVLNPNRNVDRIFRHTLITRADGEVVTGLFRREEGELLVLVDAAGRELTVAKRDVVERRMSETSLMPANFGETIPENDFRHLLAYLLGLRVGDK